MILGSYRRGVVCLAVIVFLCSFPLFIQAEEVEVDFRTLSQVQPIRGKGHRVPVNEYFHFEVEDLPKNMSINADMRGFMEFPTYQDQFDIYQIALHMEPTSTFSLDGGRQWLTDGFDGGLMDGLKMAYAPETGKVGVSLYGGVPRFTDDAHLAGVTNGLNAGWMLHLQQVEDTTGQLSLQYRKFDLERGDYRENDAIFAGLAASHQWSSLKMTPSLYSDVEYNVAGKNFETGAMGLDLYPHWRLALNFEGGYYNTDRQFGDVSLFDQYATDEMFQGRHAGEIKLGKGLRFFEDVAVQQFNVKGRGDKKGYRADGGVGHFWSAAKLSSTAQYYYADSFGGTVHGAMFEWLYQEVRKLELQLNVDVSTYSKITNQKNNAVSVVGGARYEFNPRCFLMLGGEFNNNAWFDEEARVTMQLQIGMEKLKKKI